MINGKKAVTPGRAAKRLGVTSRTVRRWCRETLMWERLARVRGVDPPATLHLRNVRQSVSGRYWIPCDEIDRVLSRRDRVLSIHPEDLL